jgi:hypothetical protein
MRLFGIENDAPMEHLQDEIPPLLSDLRALKEFGNT